MNKIPIPIPATVYGCKKYVKEMNEGEKEEVGGMEERVQEVNKNVQSLYV